MKYKAGFYFDKDSIYTASNLRKLGRYNLLILIDVSTVTGAFDTNTDKDYNWSWIYKFESEDIDFVLETWGKDFQVQRGSSNVFMSVKSNS